LVLSIFDLILNAYKVLLEKQDAVSENSSNRIKLTQNQSLQLLFDLKFLFSLFDLKSINFVSSSNEDTNLSKLFTKVFDEYKNVCSELESIIDPFDYDISSPFIQSNITKSISRSVVNFILFLLPYHNLLSYLFLVYYEKALYGIISVNDKQLKNTAATNSTSANEKFNLLVLSNNQQRFELLPLASQQSQDQQAKLQQMQYKNQISMVINLI
jgi:hypothetical protein